MESSRYIAEITKFGERVKKIRLEKKMTQEDLAFSSNIERSELSRIEHGKRNLEFETIVKIAEALEVNLEDLFAPFVNE